MCQRLVYTGNYIMRAICKAAFGETIEEPSPASTSGAVNRSPRASKIQPRITFVRTARSEKNTAQISAKANLTGQSFLKMNSESNEPHITNNPSLGTLDASAGQLCQRFVNTRIYIMAMRAICKVAFAEPVDESNSVSSSGTNDLSQFPRLRRKVGRLLGSSVQLEPRLYG